MSHSSKIFCLDKICPNILIYCVLYIRFVFPFEAISNRLTYDNHPSIPLQSTFCSTTPQKAQYDSRNTRTACDELGWTKTEIQSDKKTDRQKDSQTTRQTDKKTGGQKYRKAERQEDRKAERQKDITTARQNDKQAEIQNDNLKLTLMLSLYVGERCVAHI